MTVFSGFFNSDSTHDRWYNAQHFSRFFDGLITDGVYYNFPESETDQTKKAFYVKSKNVGRQVTVAQGRGWFRGTWIWNDAPISLEFDALVTNLAHRIDAVVIDCDTSDEGRLNDIIIVKGTEAATSQTAYRPTLIDTETHKQYAIAFVEIIGGATAIAQANITYVVAEPQIDEIGHDAVQPVLPDPQGTPAVEALLLYSNLSKAEMKEYIDTQDAIIQAQVDELKNPHFSQISGDLTTFTAGTYINTIWSRVKLLLDTVINKLPVKYGGTGQNQFTANYILKGRGQNAIGSIQPKNGALYATADNGAPSFGTLPVAQGGTGLTSNPSMLTNLGTTSADNVLKASPRPGVTGTLPIANGGTGLTSSPSMLTNLETTSADNVLKAAPRPGVTGTLPIANGGTGQASAANAFNALANGVSDTVDTADFVNADTFIVKKNATTYVKRSFQKLVADIIAKFSGSNGVSFSSGAITLTLKSTTKLTNECAAATEVAGRVYPVALDSKGKLAVNVPWTDNNTNNAVTQQSNITANSDYEVLLQLTAGTTGAETGAVNKAAGLKFNPNTGNLTVSKVNGYAPLNSNSSLAAGKITGTLGVAHGGTGSTDGTLNGVKLGTSGSGSSIKYGYYVGSTFKSFRQPTGNAGVGQVVKGYTFANASSDALTGTFEGEETIIQVSTASATFTPASGKYFSKVTVKPTPTQEKTVTASRSAQTVTPDSGKHLSKVTVNKYPDASGTYICGSNTGGWADNDMGANNNLRYVNATAVYSKGVSDAQAGTWTEMYSISQSAQVEIPTYNAIKIYPEYRQQGIFSFWFYNSAGTMISEWSPATANMWYNVPVGAVRMLVNTATNAYIQITIQRQYKQLNS